MEQTGTKDTWWSGSCTKHTIQPFPIIRGCNFNKHQNPK